MHFSKRISILLFSLLVAFMLSSCSTANNGTTVFLVRHAEKVTGPNVGKDPNLTDTGNQRAQLLAEILADKKITRIHSSDYIRTRDTAKPLAEKDGLDIEIYDPGFLNVLATKINKAGGTHLIVGHSNTIPETVVALRGDGGTPISDDEYDRLYEVHIASDGKVLTELTRFGIAYQPSEE